MLWILIIISAYFLFSINSLGDRYLLIGSPNPKNYSFYVGVLGVLAVALIPFVSFSLISFLELLLCFLAGAVFVLFIFSIFTGLEKYEAATVVPAFGGLLPVFTFALTFFFSGGNTVLGGWNLVSFFVLIIGSFLITRDPVKEFSLGALKIAFVIALSASLYFLLAKYVYLLLGFWTGFIWMRIGTFLTALLFIFFKDVREDIFRKKPAFNKKTGSLFLFIQLIGALAFVLQNWAVDLAGMVFLPVINALMGIQYVFLFLFSFLLSFKYPRILKEKISKKKVLRKALAIFLIAGGLVLLSLK